MALVSDIATMLYYDIWEDGQLQLGLLSTQQLIDFFNETVLDFQTQTCMYSQLFTTTLLEGAPQYTIPDGLLRADDVFVAGVLLNPNPISSAIRSYRQWSYEVGTPVGWSQEQIPNRNIQLLPPPDTDSLGIPSPTDPNGGQFAPPGLLDQNNNPTTMSASGAVTMLGPTLPTTATALNSPISPIAADFAWAFVTFGVLQRIFSSDSELRDLGRAEWCGQQYQMGLDLCRAIMSEESL